MASEVLGIALAELLEGAPADACAAALELLTARAWNLTATARAAFPLWPSLDFSSTP